MNSPPDDRLEPPGRRPVGPRVSRERYLARRVGVVAVLVAVVFGAVRGVGALTGGGGEKIAGDPGSVSPDTASDAASDVTSDATSGPPPSAPSAVSGGGTVVSPATSDAPSESAESVATTPVVGDSDAGTFGPYLKTLLDDTGVTTTEVDYIVSSGLARPDFYDWPSYLGEILPEADPDIVVVTFGGNDAQAMSLLDGTFPLEWNDPVSDDAEWTAEYQRRAGDVMDLLLEDDRTVIWVGIPNDDNPEVTERMAVQDQAAKAAATERPDITFVDTWARFSGRSGNWAEYVVDPRDGVGKDVRASDGFHLNENGAEILALDIANVVRADLVERGAEL